MVKRILKQTFKMKKLSIFAISLTILFSSCGSQKKQEVAEVSKDISELSIYNLPSVWTSQNNETTELKDLRGDVLVMVMIYTTCQVACPRLVADMRDIESKLPNNKKKNVKFILVSIDPETDTPERLMEFAIENEMDSDQWLFLRGSEDDTREFAAVLAVNYKKISPMDFSHSNIISVFNQEGELVHQKEGLGVNNGETVQAIIDGKKRTKRS